MHLFGIFHNTTGLQTEHGYVPSDTRYDGKWYGCGGNY